MMDFLYPDWLPNIHPLVIHFPVVLIVVGVLTEWADVFRRTPWGQPVATGIHTGAAVSAIAAYWSGASAAATVFIPGMAHPIVDDHRTWAFGTTILASALALAHGGLFLWSRSRGNARMARTALAVLGLAAVVAVFQTAERGGRLVYEHGVGVIAGPRTR